MEGGRKREKVAGVRMRGHKGEGEGEQGDDGG